MAPVLVGTALALEAGTFHGGAALAALLGAVLIQVGTNFSNDYADFLKGADTAERKGPLRVTQAGLVTAAGMRRATALVFALAFLVGLYLVGRGGWPVLAVGLVSIAAGLAYTLGPYPLGYIGLADLFVLVFFGPVAVGGTFYVQALALTPAAVVAGLGPGLLSVAILAVNNTRDVSEDRAAGKRTLVVRLGRRFGVGLYAACAVGAALVPVALVAMTGRHWPVLGAVLVLPLLLGHARTLARTDDPAVLNPLLGATGRALLLWAVLFSTGWLL